MSEKPNNVVYFQKDEGYYSYIRFFHALPSDPLINVDLYVNNRLIVSNLSYQDFTNYLTAYPGSYQIELFPTGSTTDVLLDVRVVLNPNEIYTAAIVGTPDDVGLELIDDVVRATHTGYSYMRFANLSPNSGSVNIYLDDVLVIEDLEYLELTEYLSLNPGKHTMKVVLSSTGETVVSHPNMQLIAGNYYMTYVVGLVGRRPGIEVLIPLEGTSYLYPKTI